MYNVRHTKDSSFLSALYPSPSSFPSLSSLSPLHPHVLPPPCFPVTLLIMRSFTSLPLLALVFASVSSLVGAAAVDEQCTAEMCMRGLNEVARALPATPVDNVAREVLTNAERLSRGLPPKAPTRRMHAGGSPWSVRHVLLSHLIAQLAIRLHRHPKTPTQAKLR